MGVRQLPPLAQGLSYVCPSCLLRARLRKPPGFTLRRHFRQESFRLQKSASLASPIEAQLQRDWSKRAEKIKAGRKESVLNVLEKRGFVSQVVGERDNLDRLLTERRVGVYVGVDPTAPSLHVGHLLPLMALYWMYCYGFPAFSLLGGATVKIGDPSWRKTARAAQSDSQQTKNTARIGQQLKELWVGAERELVRNGLFEGDLERRCETVNNTSWLMETPMMEIMRLLLPGVRLGTMLGRDTVKTRMESKAGMSVAEFLYPIIQAWDFWHLYSTKGVQVQIGGSDQFGNILAGIDAINYIRMNHNSAEGRDDNNGLSAEESFQSKPMGFTIPLLTTSSGEKFSKSAGKAVWLDPSLTSPFDLYQFFLGTADDDVHRYLELFTFESLESLKQLMEDHDILRSKRLAQHALAVNVVRLVHGDEVAERTRKEHSRLFQSRSGYTTASIREIAQEGKMEPSPAEASEGCQDRAPSNSPSVNITLPRSLVFNRSMAQVLFDAGLASSRSQGERLCNSNGAYVGALSDPEKGQEFKWRPVGELEQKNVGSLVIDGDLLLLRAGKTKIRVIMLTTDEDFEARGLTAPGWKMRKSREEKGAA